MKFDAWRMQRWWRRIQRPVAVLLIGGGGFLLWARQNVPAPTTPAVVAVSDMPSGHIVTADDVALVAWPQESRPAAVAVDLEAFVGRRTTAPVRAGEPLTELRVVGPSLLSDFGPDTVAVAIPGDPVSAASIIRPGDRVNVLGQTAMGARTLVSGATVLTTSQDSGAIVAVPSSSAAQVVQAAATDSAAVVLVAD